MPNNTTHAAHAMPNVADMDTSHIDQTDSKPPFILVDGSYYLFRTYHALPPLTTSKGLHTNAVRGTLNALLKLMRRYHPTHMAVAFDTKSPTFRHELSAEYKANRPPMDAEMAEQIPYIHRLVTALGIPLIRIEGAEADDIIGTLAYRACLEGHQVVISTGDKDMAQLVNDCVLLEDSFTGKIMDVQGVIDKFGIHPRQMVDYLTLMGDASDGIRGVPGIGKKTAEKLLNQYHSLAGILENVDNIKGRAGKNLVEYADDIPLNSQLATIVTDLDVGQNWDDLLINTDSNLYTDELRALYRELEFKNELASLDHPHHPSNGSAHPDSRDAGQSSGVPNNRESSSQINKSIQASKIDNIKASKSHDKAWHCILDQAAFDDLLTRLTSADCFVIDTETSSLDWREAQLVGLSFALQAHEAYYIPVAHALADDPLTDKQLDRDRVLTALKPILENPHIGKIGQHLKYDAHILAKYGIELNLDIPFPAAVLARHTNVADAENVENGNTENSNTEDHTQQTMLKPMNWAMDTMLASYVINAAATRHGMDDLARHYLHTQTITYEDVAGKGAKQVSFDQVAIDIASDYACEDADITYQLYELFSERLNQSERPAQDEQNQQLAEDNSITQISNHTQTSNNARLLHHLEIPIAQILGQMEGSGILLNRSFLTELSARFDDEISQLEQHGYRIAGEIFNLGSPKQLGELLFEKLRVSGGKKTKSGQYSTSEAVLSKIDHPLVDVVLEYRSLAKLKSTYTDALSKVADANSDRVHTSYHQALTSTGRLSSTDPNLQNIPIRTATGRLIRQAFIAPPNRVLLAADYSQIELRLMAHFSGDAALTRAFNEGLDIHAATAAEVLGKSVDAVSAAERRNAKAINFGLLYGMSAFGLAKQLQMTREQAQDYINQYFARYPLVKDYMHRTRQHAHDHGYVQTILGRKLYTPDIHSSNRMVKQAAERAAINAPLQGSAADIIKLAMIAVDGVLNSQASNRAKMLLQVHDELVFEVDAQAADSIGTAIQTAMQQALSHTAADLGWQVDFAVPLLVEVGMGNNWDEAH